MCVYVCVCVCVCVCVYHWMCMCMYVWVCICMQVFLSECFKITLLTPHDFLADHHADSGGSVSGHDHRPSRGHSGLHQVHHGHLLCHCQVEDCLLLLLPACRSGYVHGKLLFCVLHCSWPGGVEKRKVAMSGMTMRCCLVGEAYWCVFVLIRRIYFWNSGFIFEKKIWMEGALGYMWYNFAVAMNLSFTCPQIKVQWCCTMLCCPNVIVMIVITLKGIVTDILIIYFLGCKLSARYKLLRQCCDTWSNKLHSLAACCVKGLLSDELLWSFWVYLLAEIDNRRQETGSHIFPVCRQVLSEWTTHSCYCNILKFIMQSAIYLDFFFSIFFLKSS